MSQESLTLYKFMILYMLDQLTFPLTTSQLCEFFVSRKYTTYFQIQQSINELAESAFINGVVNRNTTSYHLTRSGQEAILMFQKKIPDRIKEDILAYFEQNNYELRKEVDIVSDYYPIKYGEYMVKNLIREKGVTLLELDINVVSEEQAKAVCDRWSKKSEELYDIIMKTLLLDE